MDKRVSINALSMGSASRQPVLRLDRVLAEMMCTRVFADDPASGVAANSPRLMLAPAFQEWLEQERTPLSARGAMRKVAPADGPADDEQVAVEDSLSVLSGELLLVAMAAQVMPVVPLAWALAPGSAGMSSELLRDDVRESAGRGSAQVLIQADVALTPGRNHVAGRDEPQRPTPSCVLVAVAPPGVNLSGVPSAVSSTGHKLVLKGPATTWRQPLVDALGERLYSRLGASVEQAVIRLEPPMLGRIDISIRHASGTLNVNISATHGEVVRQLDAISAALRNDLSQRQYAEVSVHVASMPSGGEQPSGFARRRGQQRHDHRERAPGRALAEEDTPGAAALGRDGRSRRADANEALNGAHRRA